MTLHVNLPNGKSFEGVKKALNHAINQIGLEPILHKFFLFYIFQNKLKPI